MKTLLVREYLETHTFGDLAREHGVYASFSKSGHKFSLNYDQIEAKESDPLAQECRGLILSTEDGHSFLPQAMTVNGRLNYDHISPGKTIVLAYPMKRFFNYGQGSAAALDWTDPKLAILEKLDGTLCIVYYDPFATQWCVATRSVPEADITMDNGLFTFRTLFEKAVQDTTGADFNTLTQSLSVYYTYCFELTTPYNRIVVNYPDNRVTLLAVRGLVTLSEVKLDHPVAQNVKNVPHVRAYTFTSVNELIDWVSSLNPMDYEGVVVRDSQDLRLKVKNPAYVAYNRARDTLGSSERNCLELILQEKDDDVIPYLPDEIVKNLQTIKKGMQRLIVNYDLAYNSILTEANKILPGDKKTFAILCQSAQNISKLWTAPMFQMFDGKALNMKDFIKNNRKDGTWGNSFLDKLLEVAKHLAKD
jgi:hypothetical protein